MAALKCDKEATEREVACVKATAALTNKAGHVNSVAAVTTNVFQINRFSVRNKIGEIAKYL